MAEIELIAPLAPDEEQKLRATLAKVDPRAFASCDIGPQKISFTYDPTRTNEQALLRAIEQSGGKLKQVEIDSSPLL